MHAMILAAGRGERLRPLTDTVPKALIEVHGKPLIVHVVECLRAAGIHELVVNLGWLGAQIHERLGDGTALDVHIVYSDEGEHTLETAGGVVKALPLLGHDPFWVVNADVLCDYSFPSVPLGLNDLAHLVLIDNPEHKADGDFALAADRVKVAGKNRLTYAGIGLYRPEFFAGESAERRPLLPLLERWIAAERVSGEQYRGHWVDVGTPERLAAVRNN